MEEIKKIYSECRLVFTIWIITWTMTLFVLFVNRFYYIVQDLIHDLQIAKRQTWEEKEKLSAQYEEERKTNLANRVSNAGRAFA